MNEAAGSNDMLGRFSDCARPSNSVEAPAAADRGDPSSGDGQIALPVITSTVIFQAFYLPII